MQPDSLPIAIRAYPEPRAEDKPRTRSQKPWSPPDAMLVFDTETRTDATQRLTFGSYRFIESGRCLEEGLFFADDLPAEDRKTLEQYVSAHSDEVADLLTRSEFLDKFYTAVYKGRCLLVGFNLPFDLSRLAFDYKTARGRFAGGFSLGLWTYADKSGTDQRDRYRPWISIKQIDSKRALKGFTARLEPDAVDLIPEDSTSGKPKEGYIFRGHLLDLRTLAFALTDRGHTLESACEAFEVEHGKQRPARHGEVTEEYIDYNRNDVLATRDLAVKLLEEYAKHPIALQVTKAFSPASIGKAYLRAMGIRPVLERQRSFPKEYLGYAQSAFYGGRTSTHIRKVPVPVVYTDFLSMYPTVNSLMDLWRFVIARRINVVEHCQAEVAAFLERLRLNPDDLFKPATWKKLTGFVRIVPDGDILPNRAKYNVHGNDWQVAMNYLYAQSDDPNDALWVSLPDVVASALLTGKVPKIVDAFRIEPQGTLRGLLPVKLRGAIEVDPNKQDFFKVVIEERNRLKSRNDLPEKERERLDKALKVLANATSYGIYAEMIRQESDHKVKVICHGIDEAPYTCRVTHPDDPGEYCFPPMASLITGAARLMLALLEYRVTKLGGTYAMEDTDSMAIVATEYGGMVPCPGGPYRTSTGRDTIKALAWRQVKGIAQRFTTLSPYAEDAVPDAEDAVPDRRILKIEKDNEDPLTGKPRQVHCLAISAKRYTLFVKDKNGHPALLRASCPHCGRKNKPDAVLCGNPECRRSVQPNNEDDRWSEHGLGHLLNPTDLDNEDRKWIAQVWLAIVRKALGLTAQGLAFEHLPAVGRTTISSPAVMRPLANLNKGKPYCDRLKPFNFLLSCHVKPLGHPTGVDPEHFHLIAPYETDPKQWLKREWIDQYSGKRYRIITAGHHGTRQTARVKTYSDVLLEYEYHPEAKCADANGNTSGRQTIGLLDRRHIRVEEIKYIGKESNSLEEVESGLEHSAENAYTEYPDQRRDYWQTKVVPAMRKVALRKLHEETGLSRRMLIKARLGKVRPHPRNQKMIEAALRKFGCL